MREMGPALQMGTIALLRLIILQILQKKVRKEKAIRHFLKYQVVHRLLHYLMHQQA